MASATRIGVDKLYYALLTLDDGTTLTYDTPVALPGVMKISINPNPAEETLFFDDGPGETATTLGKIDVEIEKNALSSSEKGVLLGHGVDAKGALVYGGGDVPPWVAIGFRTMKSNGNYRYVWLYKGRFMEPEDNNETKGDSINFQSDTIKGQFAKTNKEYVVNSKTIQPWKAELDEDDPTADVSSITNWFTGVYAPDSVAAAALTVVVAAGSSTIGSTKATITGVATDRFAVGYGTGSLAPVYVGGTPIVSVDPYTSAADIPGAVVGKHLYVYDLDEAGKIVKFYEEVLEASDIKST